MAVLVHDDAVVEITVQVGRGRRPHVHLHAGTASVWRCREVGIVGAAAILRLGAHIVIAHTAAAVVVHLEVTSRLIEAVLILNVVNDVVPVEQVRDGSVPVGRRGGGQVERERAVERRAAVGLGDRRCVVAIAVLIRVDVIAAHDGVFRAGHPVGVVPPEQGGHRMGRINHRRPPIGRGHQRRVVRAFNRPGVHLVLVRRHPVETRPDAA